ncbi:hypothetical protein BH24ACT13_BH24ACT13_16090 [soil metagenome]
MHATRRTAAAIVATAVLSAGLGAVGSWMLSGEDPAPITEEHAVALLDTAVGLAQAQGADEGYCRQIAASQTFCRINSAEASREGRLPPRTPPQIVASTPLDASYGGQQWILRLAGEDGAGNPYTTDFVVLRGEGNRPQSMAPVFWLSQLFSNATTVSPTEELTSQQR